MASVGRRIGEILLYGGFIFADAEELWPVSHIGALFFFIVLTVGLLLYDGGFSGTQTAAVTAVCVIACGLIYFNPAPTTAPSPPAPLPPIPLEDTEVQGSLRPANEPTPPNVCILSHTLKVFIGDNAITIGQQDRVSLLRVGGCEVLSVEKAPDGLFINANLFDASGMQIATISHNVATALTGEHFTARQSYDRSTLTVKTASGEELLYVRYLNPTAVRVRGMFGCFRHPLVPVRDDQPIPGVFMSHTCIENMGMIFVVP
jgi:hypothetical protein